MSGEVATVHRRDVLGIKGTKIASVVPVVEVPSNQFQLAHGGECGLQPLHRVERAQVSQIVRRQGGQKIQPDIGWRGAMSNNWRRFFLEVVRRQCTVGGSDESFEEVPGPARNQPEGASVRRSERLGADAPGGKASLPCDRGGGNPKGDQRKHGSPSSVTPG